MAKVTRDKTSFTGVLNAQKFDTLASLKDTEALKYQWINAKNGGGGALWNAYRKEYDSASKYALFPKFPIQIDFELNATCNLKCPMCPLSVESNADKKGIDFPFDIFCKVIDEGLDMGLKSIRMNYLNEPLLRKDLEKFIVYAKIKGILDIYFSTNGMLLDEKRAESLIESGVDRIQISLDAYTENTYNKMRPGGDYKRVVNNILALIAIKNKRNLIAPLIRVNFVRTELNEHELDDFINFWEDKADMIGVQEMVKPPRSTSDLKSKTTTKMESFKCSFPNKNLVITAEGNVLPCCTFYGDEMPIGNLFDELNKNKNFKISEFWDSKKMQDLRNLHCNGMYKMHPICKKCVEDSQY